MLVCTSNLSPRLPLRNFLCLSNFLLLLLSLFTSLSIYPGCLHMFILPSASVPPSFLTVFNLSVHVSLCCFLSYAFFLSSTASHSSSITIALLNPHLCRRLIPTVLLNLPVFVSPAFKELNQRLCPVSRPWPALGIAHQGSRIFL